jgi:diguanylate cyclase (GGDEF)-like protein
MGDIDQPGRSNLLSGSLPHLAGFTGIFVFSLWLRQRPHVPDSVAQGYLQIISGLIALIFSAVTLVRFRGTRDRISLILGAGFLLTSAIILGSSIVFFRLLPGAPQRIQWAPLAWWPARMLLAALLLVAIVVDRFLPRSRHPGFEIGGALFAVVVLTYFITIALRHLPQEINALPGAVLASPWNLLPAPLYWMAGFGFRRRLATTNSAFDRAIYSSTWLHAAAQIAACQSERVLDAPFAFAQLLIATAFAVILGGALLDNARLFDEVNHLASSDALTGLANYRRLLDVLDTEMERSGRTGRPFAVLLLDLDGLKRINDTLGHLVGSRALCRLANVLRINCRTIDTAARYGGDEFALVLPETGDIEAQHVIVRIRERLLKDKETPPISASIGAAVYPEDGATIEKLLAAADRFLYAAKARRPKRGQRQPPPPNNATFKF